MSEELVSTAGGLDSSAGRSGVAVPVDPSEVETLSLLVVAGFVGLGDGAPMEEGFEGRL